MIFIITAEPFGGINTDGKLKIYDFSAIFVPEVNFNYKTPVGTAFIPNRPIALTAFTDRFDELGGGQRNIAAVTTTDVPRITRPNNIWFYDITDATKPHLVGVVSLSIPQYQNEIPVSVTVHQKRAYIGNVSFGGALVVDIEEAIRLFKEKFTELGGNDPARADVAIRTISSEATASEGGFGQQARIQRGVYSGGPGQPSPVRGVSVITQNTGNRLSPIAYLLSSSLPKLISFDFNNDKDGLLDFFRR